MRGLVLVDEGQVALRTDLPEPRIEDPRDAIVAVHAAGLCGSDLHPYHGREAAARDVVQGHELVGEVVATGADVRRLTPGTRVVSAFTTSCGRCPTCQRGVTARCPQGQLLGWGPPGRLDLALHGGQADLVRIPLADGTLVPIDPAVDDATAVLLADNLPTAWEALERAEVTRGRPVVVVGLGSVGLCAVAAAHALGADPVVGVDPVADRRERARRLGAVAAASPTSARPTVREALGTVPLLSVVEAAGMAAAQRTAFELLDPGGTLSIIAVQTDPSFAFSPVAAYDANLTVRVGRASVRRTLERLLPQLADGRWEPPTSVVVTHPDLPLEEGPETYARFAAREPGLVKAAFRP